MVANGNYNPILPDYQNFATVPLTYDDLLEPVPASNWYDARHGDCWGKQSHCSTMTDGNFRPQLYLDRRVWLSKVMKKNETNCFIPYIVDPPIILSTIREDSTPIEFPERPYSTTRHFRPTSSVQGENQHNWGDPAQQVPPRARPGHLFAIPTPASTSRPGDRRRPLHKDESGPRKPTRTWNIEDDIGGNLAGDKPGREHQPTPGSSDGQRIDRVNLGAFKGLSMSRWQNVRADLRNWAFILSIFMISWAY